MEANNALSSSGPTQGGARSRIMARLPAVREGGPGAPVKKGQSRVPPDAWGWRRGPLENGAAGALPRLSAQARL